MTTCARALGSSVKLSVRDSPDRLQFVFCVCITSGPTGVAALSQTKEESLAPCISHWKTNDPIVKTRTKIDALNDPIADKRLVVETAVARNSFDCEGNPLRIIKDRPALDALDLVVEFTTFIPDPDSSLLCEHVVVDTTDVEDTTGPDGDENPHTNSG